MYERRKISHTQKAGKAGLRQGNIEEVERAEVCKPYDRFSKDQLTLKKCQHSPISSKITQKKSFGALTIRRGNEAVCLRAVFRAVSLSIGRGCKDRDGKEREREKEKAFIYMTAHMQPPTHAHTHRGREGK